MPVGRIEHAVHVYAGFLRDCESATIASGFAVASRPLLAAGAEVAIRRSQTQETDAGAACLRILAEAQEEPRMSHMADV